MFDLLMGMCFGLFQGVFFNPLYNSIVNSIMKSCFIRNSMPFWLAVITAHCLAIISVGFFLILTISLRDLVAVWNHYLIGWGLGFTIGVVIWTLLKKPT